MAWVLENDLPGVNATGPVAGGGCPLPDFQEAIFETASDKIAFSLLPGHWIFQ
jgi:hypothetical protein